MLDDGDAIFLGDGDLFGNSVPCLAGELELQVQSYVGGGDVHVDVSSDGKSFSLTKDSGGSSLSALAAVDFGNPDFMDNVSLDDLAAADHYGHTVCGRQSTADSTAAADSSRKLGPNNHWTIDGGAGVASSHPTRQGHPHDGLQGGQESSDCDMSHTHGDGESSGVGPGKSAALGSSHSEASEGNTAGATPGATSTRDEEHISMPSYGLSLSRLTHSGVVQNSLVDVEIAQQVDTQTTQREHQQQRTGQQQQHHQEQQQDRQQQQHTEQAITGEQQRGQITRAFSVDEFPLAGSATPGGGGFSDCPDFSMDGLRRAQVYRSYSYVAPGTLPMDFSLGCGDLGGSQFTFGARGRCASLNETQLRRHWLQEGELLTPQLPPSVSELELLELPEDSIPIRPHSTGAFLGQSSEQRQQPASDLMPGSEAGPLGLGFLQFKGSSSSGVRSSNGTPMPGMAVKRKIITSPSPLVQQPKSMKTRQSTAAAAAGSGATPKCQSPKRAKIGCSAAAAWQDAAGAAPSSAGLLAGWHPQRQTGSGSMKTVRSVPANMNSYLDGVEVTVQPLGLSVSASTFISQNSNTASASVHQAVATRGPFFDPVGAGSLMTAAGKGVKSKTAAGALQAPGLLASVMPGAFTAPGLMVGPDGKRLGPLPSVPKPRKRASPNGNPPKAPAPNPNGHCCTQCGTQTTPVWRAGPHGPKTLCNACGVRYMKVAKGNVVPAPRRQQH